MNRLPVLIITGPTATGKSETAVAVAEALETEIISADSLQVYRHFNIGTAKPHPSLRHRVSHHLIDILEPDEDFTAFDFKQRCDDIIRRLHAENRIPVLAGGTGLYLRVLTEDLNCAAPADAEIRNQIRQEIEQRGSEALHAELQSIDPEAASRIRPTDPVRIERALEVYRLTGTPMSDFHRDDALKPSPYDVRVFALEMDRDRLYKMINQRVDSMMSQGWLDEVQGLLDSGLSPELKPFQAIGYRQLAGHLKGENALESAVEEIKRDTRHYAKRQVTWFKKHAPGSSLPVSSGDTPQSLARTILERVPRAIAAGLLTLWIGLAPTPSPAQEQEELQFIGQQILRDRHEIACARLSPLLEKITGDSTAAHPISYLNGHCLIHEKKWKEGIQQLQASLKTFPELEDYTRFYLAKAWFFSGELTPALEEVTTLLTRFPDSRIAPEAELLRSEVLKSQGQIEKALFLLQEAIHRWSAEGNEPEFEEAVPDLMFQEARLHEMAGVPSRAYLAYRKITVKFADHSRAEAADKALARMLSAKPMEVPPLTELEVEERVAGLLKAARYREALDTLKSFESANPGKPRSPEFYFLFSTAYYGVRERLESVNTLKDFLKQYPLHTRVQDARFKVGRALWNLGRNSEAMRYFEIIGQTTGKKSWKVRSHFYLGRVLENTGQFEKARKHYETLLEIGPNSSYTRKAAWRLGWMDFREDRLKEAAEQFAANARRWPNDVRTSKNLFWEAKVREHIKDKEAAQKVYADLFNRFPYTFYGVRAESRLPSPSRKAQTQATPQVIKTVFESPREETGTDLGRSLSENENFHYQRALTLSKIGWFRYARLEAKKVAATIRKNLSGTLWLADLYITTHSYPEALRLLYLYRDYKTLAREKELPVAFWKQFFPLAYFETVEAAAREYEVDPLFVGGLMRQESLFDAEIISPAGARGLMQIMPETGRRLFSPGPKYSSYDPDALFDPELNVRLGVKYLSNLTRQFGPNGIYLLISYNAGPHVLKKWLKRFSNIEDEDVFVESIPYPETRGYVKRVLRNYGIYQRLYLKRDKQTADNKTF